MKYKAITSKMLLDMGKMAGIGTLTFIAIVYGWPLVFGGELVGNDWPWIVGLLNWISGWTLVPSTIGVGFMAGVSRKTMVRAYLSVTTVMAAGFATVGSVLGHWAKADMAHAFKGFMQPGFAVVSWGYMFAIGMALGICGLLSGLIIVYTSRHAMVWMYVVVFAVFPGVLMLLAIIAWAMLVWLVPGFKALSTVLVAQPWSWVGALLLIAALFLAVFAGVYRRLNAPQQLGVLK